MRQFNLVIDEVTSQVTFSSESLIGAKAGLAELRRKRRHYLALKREAFASVREKRVLYRGHQAIRKFRTSKKDPFAGLVAAFANLINSFRRIDAYEEMANSEIDVSKFDRVIAAIDKMIIRLESEIDRAKHS